LHNKIIHRPEKKYVSKKMRCNSCYYRLMCKKIVSIDSECENYLNDSKININDKELLGVAADGLTFNNELITRFLNDSNHKSKV